MNGESERMCKEAVMAWIEEGLLSWNLSGRIDENQ
jgi:hypothetical protein